MSFNQMAEALQSQIRKLVELSRVQRTFVSVDFGRCINLNPSGERWHPSATDLPL